MFLIFGVCTGDEADHGHDNLDDVYPYPFLMTVVGFMLALIITRISSAMQEGGEVEVCMEKRFWSSFLGLNGMILRLSFVLCHFSQLEPKVFAQFDDFTESILIQENFFRVSLFIIISDFEVNLF